MSHSFVTMATALFYQQRTSWRCCFSNSCCLVVDSRLAVELVTLGAQSSSQHCELQPSAAVAPRSNTLIYIYRPDTYSCWMQSADDVSYIFPLRYTLLYPAASLRLTRDHCQSNRSLAERSFKGNGPQFRPIVFNWVSWIFLVFQGWITSRGKAGPHNPKGHRKPQYNNN